MRFCATVLILFVALLTVESQTKRALLVGIGEYPSETGWSAIHGDNDVPLISDVLIKRGFAPENIDKLTNNQATKKKIMESLKKLKTRANPNDIIYIHFSTHGQQVTDIDGDEEDGFDEAIIPFDASKAFNKGSYEGENHLVDDELNSVLSEIRAKIGKSGTLLVVVDACHSGDSTRGETDVNDSIVIRGTNEVFNIGAKRDFKVKSVVKKIDWVEISATQSYQNNYEFKINGMYYGSLSYAIKLTLPELTYGSDFTTLFKLIQQKREEMNVSRYPQRPMMLGNSFYLNQKVF